MSTIWTMIRPYFSALFMVAGSSHGSSSGPSGAAWVTLICGIASWFFLPLIAAVVGFFVGRGELKKIERGTSSQSGEAITKVGYYLCIANLIITIVGGCISTALIIAIWGGLIAGLGGLAVFSEIAHSLP